MKDRMGDVQPNISVGYLKNIQIELIPVNEQKSCIFSWKSRRVDLE